MIVSSTQSLKKTRVPGKLRKTIFREWQLYVLCLPAVAYFFIFHYIPMYGLQVAFKDFSFSDGIIGSPWVGFKHFEYFLNSYQALRVLRNTIVLSFYEVFAGFPIPVILALLLNQVRNLKFKKFVQTVTYAPHFISIVVLVGMLYLFLSPSSGVINKLIEVAGGDPIFFFGEARWFRHVYVLSDIWQNSGWNMIIFLAALSAVPPDLYESAVIDGATRFQRIIYIDFFYVLPPAIIMLILRMGRVMNLGFQKAYLMQTDLNLETAEIINTYVYKTCLLGGQFSYAAAIGFFQTAVNLALVFVVNRIARKLSETSLW